MMYELVTGRPPFLGGDSIAIISQHINARTRRTHLPERANRVLTVAAVLGREFDLTQLARVTDAADVGAIHVSGGDSPGRESPLQGYDAMLETLEEAVGAMVSLS